MEVTKESIEKYTQKLNSLENNMEGNLILNNISKIFCSKEQMRFIREFKSLKNSCDINKKNLEEKGMKDKVIKAMKILDNLNVSEEQMEEKKLIKLSEEIKKMEENPQNKKVLKETLKMAYPHGRVPLKYDALKNDVSHLITHYLNLTKIENKSSWEKDRIVANKTSIKYFISSYKQLKEDGLKKEVKKVKKEVSSSLEM